MPNASLSRGRPDGAAVGQIRRQGSSRSRTRSGSLAGSISTAMQAGIRSTSRIRLGCSPARMRRAKRFHARSPKAGLRSSSRMGRTGNRTLGSRFRVQVSAGPSGYRTIPSRARMDGSRAQAGIPKGTGMLMDWGSVAGDTRRMEVKLTTGATPSRRCKRHRPLVSPASRPPQPPEQLAHC